MFKRKGGFCLACGKPINEKQSAIYYVLNTSTQTIQMIFQLHSKAYAPKFNTVEDRQNKTPNEYCTSKKQLYKINRGDYFKQFVSGPYSINCIDGDSKDAVKFLKAVYAKWSPNTSIYVADILGLYDDIKHTSTGAVPTSIKFTQCNLQTDFVEPFDKSINQSTNRSVNAHPKQNIPTLLINKASDSDEYHCIMSSNASVKPVMKLTRELCIYYAKYGADFIKLVSLIQQAPGLKKSRSIANVVKEFKFLANDPIYNQLLNKAIDLLTSGTVSSTKSLDSIKEDLRNSLQVPYSNIAKTKSRIHF